MLQVAKTLTLIGIMSGIVLLFYFAGLITDTGTSLFLDLLIRPQDFQIASIAQAAFASAGILIGISTLVLRSSGSSTDQYLMIAFLYLFLNFGWDFLDIYNSVAAFGEVAQVLAVLIFSPFLLWYVISVIEWWRGVET